MAATAAPGQFVMIRVQDQVQPLLRRPLSLHDAGDGTLDVFFRIAGQGTALLAAKTISQTLDVIGPFGKGYRLDGSWKGRDAWLVGGGRGIAPLFFLGRSLLAIGARVKILYGGKTLAEIPLREKFERTGMRVACSTDDGSFGLRGFVTALLEKKLESAKPAGLFICGPDPMMKTAARLASSHGIPAQLSLEAIMGCGFGACWGCVHRIKRDDGGGWRKICEDGPVFEAGEIVWDEA